MQAKNVTTTARGEVQHANAFGGSALLRNQEPWLAARMGRDYFLSFGGVMPGNGKAPNMALLWFCICSCICRNRFFDWSM